MRTGTLPTEVTAIDLCTSCSRVNKPMLCYKFGSVYMNILMNQSGLRHYFHSFHRITSKGDNYSSTKYCFTFVMVIKSATVGCITSHFTNKANFEKLERDLYKPENKLSTRAYVLAFQFS